MPDPEPRAPIIQISRVQFMLCPPSRRPLNLCVVLGLKLSLGIAACASPAFAIGASPADTPAAAPEKDQARDIVIVTGSRGADPAQPASVETRTGEEIAITTSITNAEDALRYFPNILVRKRHIGDTQAPITTRTSGVGASARSLIFVDGALISALIGNNNSTASPKWGMVSPEEIASIDVTYGPFSAAYAGNSIGAVVDITTRMPEAFEGSVSGSVSIHTFNQYAVAETYDSRQAGVTFGNRFGPLAFWLAATQTDSRGQPLVYLTAAQSSVNALSSDPVITGAIADVNRTGAPILVLGAGGIEDQLQDTVKVRVSYDFDAVTRLAYTIGRFSNDTASGLASFLRNASGADVFAGGPYNIGGRRYTIPASTFSNSLYNFNEEQWSQTLTLGSRLGADLDWRFVATDYAYGLSQQRLPGSPLPAARTGGAGSIVRGDGTRWQTLDAKAVWRAAPAHEVSFGLRGERYELASERFATTDWIRGPAGAMQSASRGKTQTAALWIQDAWTPLEGLTLITGGRYESWRAYDGFNYSASPALNVSQPERDTSRFSPKASLSYALAPGWSTKVSIGQAFRFPTVGELYQAINTGVQLTVPDPSLKPENAVSTEITLERETGEGRIRLSAFTEDIRDALVSQSAPLMPNSTQLFTYVQNIDKVESRGLELVGSQNNVLLAGLSLTGNLTWVDARTTKNLALPAAAGKRTPQVPEWRATLVATYRPDDQWAFTLAGRYVDRVYATIDNSDSVSHTYQGFEAFMTWDARIAYDFNASWTGALSLENLADADYFLFHPFPQRTLSAELTYRF